MTKEVTYFWKEKTIGKESLTAFTYIYGTNQHMESEENLCHTYFFTKSNLRIVFNCFSTELSF